MQTKNMLILLVDDDEALRTVTGEALKGFGYEVFQAVDGEEAMEVYAAHKNEIAVIITDIMMPKMNGIELAKCIWKRDKCLPIIFVTGHYAGVQVPSEYSLCQSRMISKPYPFDYLHQQILDMTKAGLPFDGMTA